MKAKEKEKLKEVLDLLECIDVDPGDFEQDDLLFQAKYIVEKLLKKKKGLVNRIKQHMYDKKN